jgi:integrase
MSKRTRSRRKGKPAKPRPDFPLFPHATRRWAKKIRGKLHYFGPWEDPEGALTKYLDQKDDLHAGRRPRAHAGEVLVRDVLNHFLTAKKQLLDSGELTPGSWALYHATCERIATAFGRTRPVADLRPDDFADLRAAVAKKWGPVALGNEIQRVRTVFKHAYDATLIDAPVRFGPGFKKPSQKVLRLARAARGPRLFEPYEIRAMLAASAAQLKAMILFGVNCGFGNGDCGRLTKAALDLEGGWVNFARPKTGIMRRCPLWPETVEALRRAIELRPKPRDPADDGLVFLTGWGNSWARQDKNNPVSTETAKVLRALEMHRPGRGFYTLRHVFETVGGEARDQVAVDAIMGHVDGSMASAYREKISDERLRAVTDHVRAWLFGEPATAADKSASVPA